MLSSDCCPRKRRSASKLIYAEVSGVRENKRQGPKWHLPFVGMVFPFLFFLSKDKMFRAPLNKELFPLIEVSIAMICT